ncbi:MAG: hypothetical protein M1820_002268 [Bogoriella megaspora]|nr:MAG: hypothetical protein M1820_002268 [Bogoriella megaspora]
MAATDPTEDNAASDLTSSPMIDLTLTFHGKPQTFTFPSNATVTDLSDAISTTLSIPPSNQKLIVPKLGLLRPPFADPTLPISSLTSKKVTLMGATAAEASAISSAGSSIAAEQAHRRAVHAKYAATASHSVDNRKVQDEATYTFHTLRPLDYMPNPERSLKFLERLRDDAGIKAAMRKHKFSVELLTEMDPAMHTTQESRTLGLNRNKGEVIELRLRTDAGDGYRDYATIRRTLCHELTHNVWGDHDRRFWDLCKEIEKEVGIGDWKSGGRSVGSEEFAREVGMDEGGWEGGEFVLGSGESAAQGNEMGGLSRREIMARAAEERLKKQKQASERTKDDGTA